MSRILTTCIALFVCLTFVRTQVTVEEGAYSNVLVSFSQNVPPEKGHILLNKLQEHLSETSNLLRNAINLGISKVTFVIPRSWDTSKWNITVEPLRSESNARSDIVVDDVQDSVFGTFPFAQQHGSCSVPGARIIVPSSFLTEDDAFPKGTALAREWLKYRYGVFDENGYTGDELYPIYYHVPGTESTDFTVTGCTNKPVMYNFTDSNGNECTPLAGKESTYECRANPEEESLENVTSSLMYFHEKIHNMQHVCGKDPEHLHSSRSQNKHNSLCRGQSVWEVLKMSGDFGDFNSSETETASEDSYDIQFNYVQEPKPKVVIAWEYTTHLKSQGATVLKAVRKFLYDLPVGSKYSLLPFTDTMPEDKEYSLQELNNWPEDWKIIKIFTDFLINKKEGCVKCAIAKALDIVTPNNPEELSDTSGTAIIIATSNPETDEDLLNRLRASKMCLILFAFSNGETPKAYQDYTDASPCGTLVKISLDGNTKEVFETLFKVMESILPETVGDKMTETVKTESVQEEAENVLISFPVNAETAEKVTFWILRNPIFQPSDLSIVESVTIDSKEVKLTSEDTTDVLALSFSPQESGNVEFKLHDGIAAIVQVRITLKPGTYISGDIHYHDTTKGESEEHNTSKVETEEQQQMPVILYTRVRFGSYPVQNAEVSAEISRPDEEPVVVKMYDDGSGDPDITANDGVYSGYFIDFSKKGEYEVTVTVKNNDDAATAGKLGADHKGGHESCCGSKLETGTVQIPSFEKTFKTITFSARSGPPKDGYQPSRIVDLRVDNVTDDKVVLKWTAPGAEADKGTVTSYDIKYFTTEEDLLKFENGKSLNCNITPQERGSQETCEVDYTNFDDSMIIYIAIKSINNMTIISDTSNIIEIFVSDIQTTTVPDEEKGKDDIQKGGLNKKTVGIIIGVILGLIVLIIIIYVIVYFAVVKPKRKQEKKTSRENPVNQITNSTSQSHQLSPITSVSVDTLIRHHNEKERAKIQNKTAPIYKEDDFEENPNFRAEPKNTEQHEYTEVQRDSRNAEDKPPKSPKRTTNV